MPSPASHIPDDGSDLARRLRDLEGRLQRLEAARRLQQVGVSSGVAPTGGGTALLTLATPDAGTGSVQLQLQATSVDGTTKEAVLVTFPDGTTVTLSPTGAYLGSWVPLTLVNGWTAAGGGWAAPVMRRQIDGTVQLSGEIAPGTLTAGTTLFTLAAPPAADLEFRVPGGSATAAADLYVHSSGAVTLQNVAGTITRIGLASVRYPT